MEMFNYNTAIDDIAMLENLLTQIRDNVDLNKLPVTAFDKSTKTDYGIDDVIQYLDKKYHNIIFQEPST